MRKSCGGNPSGKSVRQWRLAGETEKWRRSCTEKEAEGGGVHGSSAGISIKCRLDATSRVWTLLPHHEGQQIKPGCNCYTFINSKKHTNTCSRSMKIFLPCSLCAHRTSIFLYLPVTEHLTRVYACFYFVLGFFVCLFRRRFPVASVFT